MKLRLFATYLALFALVRFAFAGFASMYFAPALALTFYLGQTANRGPLRVLLPLVLMCTTDFILGGMHTTLWLGYAIIALASYFAPSVRTESGSHTALLLYGIGTITAFDLVTNYAVWYGSAFYPQTLAGLVACFTAAIPFYLAKLSGLAAVSVVHRQLLKRPTMNVTAFA